MNNMMNNPEPNFFYVNRGLLYSDRWLSEKFTRGQAWVDLIILANHESAYFYKRGVKININRGQVGWSSVALSERWKWSRSKVNKFLNDLKKEQQIKQIRLSLATSFYNAAACLYNAEMKEEALSVAEKALLHPTYKEKTEQLISKIKELK